MCGSPCFSSRVAKSTYRRIFASRGVPQDDQVAVAGRYSALVQGRFRDADKPSVAAACPDCGLVLQTLDLPCPVCGPDRQELAAHSWTLHEFSKTFRTRHLIRPVLDHFVSELNRWMANEPGLASVSPLVHRDRHGVVSGVTLTCKASSEPVDGVFRLHRLLLAGALGLHRRELGVVLNEWNDSHPDLTRVGHQVLSSAGVPLECWLLSFGPRSSSSAEADGTPRSPVRFPLAFRSVVAVLFFLFVLLSVAAVGTATHTESWVDPFALAIAAFSTGGAWRWAARRSASKAPLEIGPG